jgi:hypothetical protein
MSAPDSTGTPVEPIDFQSYRTPIPAGVTRVEFRGHGFGAPDQWTIRDASIWSRQ